MNYVNFFKELGFNNTGADILSNILIVLSVVLLSVAGFYITRFIIIKIVQAIITKSKNDYDDFFIKNKVFYPLAHVVSVSIVFWGLKYMPIDNATIDLIQELLYSFLLFVALVISFRLLNTLNDIYEVYANKKNISVHIKQYIQVVKIILVITVFIFIISIITDKKPGTLLAGLGAMTAVLLLIFKDSILSLVASVQISAYNLVKVGDWITIPSKGVDGDIMDISLNTIKIRNFDKTISTVPTYTLVQDTFINWRGMVQSGGRRIKRSINIDVNTVKMCNKEMIEKFKKINLISGYVSERQREIDEWNRENNIPEPIEINGRAQTNLGIFRVYLERYIKSKLRVFKKYSKETFEINNELFEFFVIDDYENFKAELDNKVDKFLKKINGKWVIKELEKFLIIYDNHYVLENNYLYKIRKIYENRIINGVQVKVEKIEKVIAQEGEFADDLTILVRQLSPTEKGIPVEIYAFAATTAWGEYEKIQSDLFEHIFAILPHFELKVYQEPSSVDFKTFIEAK